MEIPASAISENAAIADRRRRARAVAVIQFLIGDIVSVRPERVPGLRFKAGYAFLFFRLILIAEGEPATLNAGAAEMATADGLAPARFEFGGELFGNVGIGPDAIAV